MIYMDNAATTPVSNSVKLCMQSLIDEFENPSSSYKPSRDIYCKILEAKESILESLGADKSGWNVYFTSGGTESNNWALRGILEAVKKKDPSRNRLVISSVEHPSVYNTAMALEGFKVSVVHPDSSGVIIPKALDAFVDEHTALVSIMAVNNQVGTIEPVKEYASICHKNGALFHSDCVQAVGHIPLYLDNLDVDLISASSHKFGGLKGSGFLCVKNNIELGNLMFGGKQNSGKRPGTESLINIVTTARALDECAEKMSSYIEKTSQMRNKIVTLLKDSAIDFIVNGSWVRRAPGNLNISFKNIDGSELATLLEADGIYISTTSACETGEKQNRVLKEIKVPDEFINGTIRISLSENNTEEECSVVADSIIKNVKMLSKRGSYIG